MDIGEGDVVAQAEGGHVAHHVQVEEQDHGLAVARHRLAVRKPHEHAADDEQQAHDLLGGKKAVGDDAEEEGCDDGRERRAAVGAADEVRQLVSAQAGAQGGKPGSPEEELEKHHDGELGDDGALGGLRIGHDTFHGCALNVGCDGKDAPRP